MQPVKGTAVFYYPHNVTAQIFLFFLVNELGVVSLDVSVCVRFLHGISKQSQYLARFIGRQLV